jgi:hypothetical protein
VSARVKKLRRPGRLALIGSLVLALAGAWSGATFAAFTSPQGSSGNVVTAVPDWRAPTVSALAIGKTSGGTPGYVRQAGTYYVYANVADTGNPASGIATVTANTSDLTTGEGAAVLSSGSWTVGGQTYNYRSAALTADAVITEGSKAFSITATDNASNGDTTNGTVIVDNTSPTGTNVQATNTSGGTVGRADPGDTITYTFSEPVEPSSILAGWNGSAQAVTLQLINGGGAVSDNVQIWNQANTAQLALGQVDLIEKGYTNSTVNFTDSTMTMTGNTVTVVLGTASGAVRTEANAGAMLWTPSGATKDRADNSGLTTSAAEATPLDVEF